MSQQQRMDYQTKVKRMGAWVGVRFLKNRGVSFEDAHLIVLGIPPRW